MAIVARFTVDTREWDAAVVKAKASIQSFDQSAKQLQNRMNSVFQGFDASKVRAEATAVAAAYEKVGGAIRLTAEEQRKVNVVMAEAIEKSRLLGKDVPKAWEQIAKETAGATKQTDSFFKTLVGGVTVANLASQAITGLARGAVSMAKEFFASADALVSLSDKTGISLTALQKLDYAARQSGTTLEDMTQSISMLQDRLGSGDKSAAKAFQFLKLSIDDLRASRPEDAFQSIVRALAGVEDVNARVAASRDLFGRAGAAVLQLAENYDRLTQEAQDLGLVLDEQLIRQTEELGDKFEALERQAKATIALGLAPMIPVMTDLANAALQLAPRIGKAFADAFVGIRIGLLELQAGVLDAQAMAAQAAATMTPFGLGRGALTVGSVDASVAANRLRQQADRLVLEQMTAGISVMGQAAALAANPVERFGEAVEALGKTGREWGPSLKEAGDSLEDMAKGLAVMSGVVPDTRTLADWLTKSLPNLDLFGEMVIRGVGPKLSAGLTSLPGAPLPKDVFGEDLLKAQASRQKFADGLAQTMLSAFTGGGEVGRSLGGFLGKSLFGAGSGLGKMLSGGLTKALGSTVGGALGSILPGIGTLLGGLAGDWLGGLFGGGDSKKTKQMREDFLAQAGGLDEVRKMADYAGVSIDRLLNTKKSKEFEREVRKLEAAFAAVQKRVQGLVTELGTVQSANGLLSGDLANRLLGDFDKPEIQQAFKTFVTENLTAATTGLQRFLDVSKDLPLTAKSAEAFGGALAGLFQRMRELGATSAAALKALTPAIDALVVRLKAAGLEGGAAFADLQAMAALATDEVAGPLLEGVDSLTQAMVGLSNAGLLTEDMFQGLAEQIGVTWDRLIREGKSGDQALRLMAPSLQRLWELQQKWGWAVDDTTQALIDQAKEQGLVGDHMKDVMSQVLDVLKAIAKVLGADIPEAARKANEAINAIEIPEVPDYTNPKPPYTPPPPEPYARGGLVPQYLATGGWPARGTDIIPAMLSPGEYVVSAPAVRRIGTSALEALNRGALPDSGQTINISIAIDTLDTQSVRQAVEQDIAPALVEVLRQNVRGIRTETRYALGVS